VSHRQKVANFHSLKDIKKGKYGKYKASCILILGKMAFYFTYTQ